MLGQVLGQGRWQGAIGGGSAWGGGHWGARWGGGGGGACLGSTEGPACGRACSEGEEGEARSAVLHWGSLSVPRAGAAGTRGRGVPGDGAWHWGVLAPGTVSTLPIGSARALSSGASHPAPSPWVELGSTQCVVLCCVVLCCVLCCAVLCCAVLCCAVLCCGVLCCVALYCVLWRAVAHTWWEWKP